MLLTRPLAALAFLATLLAPWNGSTAGPGQTDLPPAAGDAWIAVEERDFTVYTNGRPRVADLVTRNLLALHDVIFALNPELKPRFEIPTYVLAFNDPDRWWPYQINRSGRAEEAAGLFLSHPLWNVMALLADPNYDPYPVIYHEYTHYLLATLFPGLPAWMDEGLADYYGSLWIFSDRIELGGPVKWHLEEMKTSRWMPLARLLEVDHESADYNEARRRGRFYAQSWALVHYLLRDEPTSLAGVARYHRLREAGKDDAAALQEAFGESLEGLDARVQAFVAKGSLKATRIRNLPALGREPVRPRDVPRTEALTRLGIYLVIARLGARDLDAAHLKAALQEQSDLPEALLGMGLHHHVEERHELAGTYYRQVLQAAPEMEPGLLLLGQLQVERFMQRWQEQVEASPGILDEDLPPLPDELAEARELLQKAMRLNPRRPESAIAHGYTYLFDPGDASPGLESLERARKLFPERTELAFYLGALHMTRGQRERGEELLHEVATSGRDPELADSAGNLLVAVALEDARDLLEEGKLDEGIEALRALRDQAPDPELRRMVDGLLEQTLAFARRRAGVDAAREAAAAGSLDRSAALLESTRQQTTDPDAARRLEEQIAEVREMQSLQERLNRAQDLLEEGRLDEGEAVLREIRGTVSEPEILSVIDQNLAELSRVRRANGQVEQFNRARTLIGRGAFQEAAALLQEILSDPADPGIEGPTRELLETLQEHMGEKPAP